RLRRQPPNPSARHRSRAYPIGTVHQCAAEGAGGGPFLIPGLPVGRLPKHPTAPTNQWSVERGASMKTLPSKNGVRTARQRPIEILLIEDTPHEAKRTVHALRMGRIRSRITVVEDGEQALELLRSKPEYRPDVILLDWYLPKKDGREVLNDIKSDPALPEVPIVVLTMSDRQEDVAAAYDGHANSFVTKPASLDQFAQALKLIEVFWKGRLPATVQKRRRS